ncbi:CDP-alcohol phosphatidyltransferase family protein [Haloquadratum walsbyi]|uniref:CDP-alcohol 1-archaetidyltransferase n=1 Tax=Haloquadratum walsbyi (strain DSM 16790 / HBSQ001) TaxID=362976 RepID=Q18HA8_HALWD|nr:CDP-alcohol phosphatidyltransferase family protein [Haloquadratum walsbyi]CAJ52635.1 CDP-alcohol 1-archaetidyltransferase [Haloquadratum walsbyi DSM 16790]
MSSEIRETIEGIYQRLDPAIYRVPDTNDRIDIRDRLTGADYISLGALLFGWASALLLVRGEPNWGVIVMFAAFGFDKVDGWYARQTNNTSPFGRQIDSFIDVFAYLVPAALLYHLTLSPHLLASLVVGFCILSFGGLRLVRHNNDGFGSDGNVSYYHGTTVVHTNVIVLLSYLLHSVLEIWNGWVAGIVIIAICPLMISNYKAKKKTTAGHVFIGILITIVTLLALAIETGYL